MKLYNLHDWLSVPTDVAKCPVCHKGVKVEIMAWSDDPEGGYKADEFHVVYDCEPDYVTHPRKWRRWARSHSQDDWNMDDFFKWRLDQNNIEIWLDEQIRFVDPEADLRRLQRWCTSVLGSLPNSPKQDMTPE